MECSQVLVPLFDRFPLRSKKQTDYRVWREATLLLARYGYDAAGVRERVVELDKLQRRLRAVGLDEGTLQEKLDSVRRIELQPELPWG